MTTPIITATDIANADMPELRFDQKLRATGAAALLNEIIPTLLDEDEDYFDLVGFMAGWVIWGSAYSHKDA